ncbi:MAG: TIR domain-containing protein [Gammaproteobacteria bacterium]|nr:TIR domain-containing protein [Gammaproteobacteria bacterium]
MMKWVSECFPDATRYEKQHCTNKFSGKVRSKASNESCFELTVEEAPNDDDDWKGISGMPVFVGRRILGIVQSVPPNFTGGTLHATPTWKLLEDTAFHKVIGHDGQTALAKKIKDKLVKVLRRSPSVVNALIDQEQIDIDNDIKNLKGEQQIERLAEQLLLLKTDTCAVIEALYRAHCSLCEEWDDESSEQSAKAAEILVNAAQFIVPAVYDYGVIQWTRSQQDTSLVPLPVHIKTSAEIIMAGVDGRETRLRHRKSEKDYPEGEFSLPQIPECGIDPGNVVAREAQRDHLDRKFNPIVEVDVSRRLFDDYLEVTYYQPESGAPKRTREERIELTAGALERRRRLKGQTFYMLFYLPQDTGEQYAIRSLVQALKKDYPAIMFLSLDLTSEQEKLDQDLVYPFCCMLPMMGPETPDTAPKLLPSLQEKPSSMSTQRFKIALSFPGEYRDFVKQIATRLADQVGRDQVLYDEYYEAEFARPDLDTYLQRLYHDESELIAVFLCADYERKDWCGLEWRAIRDLIKKRQVSTVMPLRFDNTEIPGLFSTDGYVWIGGRSPQEIADLILQRLQINAGSPPPSSPPSPPKLSVPPPHALETWREKLNQFEDDLAITADSARKFELRKLIEEAKAKIRELGG